MKKLFIFFLSLIFSLCFSQGDVLKSKIKSDSAISYYEKFQKAKVISEKMKFINRAIDFEPKNYFLHASKSQLYYFEKDFITYEKSIIDLTKMFPNEGEAFYTLGFYQEDQGELESSKLNYEKALTKLSEFDVNSEYNLQPFYKMMTYLLLNRKSDAKMVVEKIPEGKTKDFYILYYEVLSNIERSKLHDFIKNELK